MIILLVLHVALRAVGKIVAMLVGAGPGQAWGAGFVFGDLMSDLA